MTKHALSIITPTLNEAKNVEILAKRIKNAVKDINYEVIIVDDNSPDKTYDIAKKLDKKYNIRAFKRIKNKGLSSAVVFSADREPFALMMEMCSSLLKSPLLKKAFLEADSFLDLPSLSFLE